MRCRILPLIAVSITFVTAGSGNGATLLASFDMDNNTGAASEPDGPAPVSGTADTPASWTKVTTGSSTLGDNGISFRNYNGTGSLDSRGLQRPRQ